VIDDDVLALDEVIEGMDREIKKVQTYLKLALRAAATGGEWDYA
jgi:hypothetical protein